MHRDDTRTAAEGLLLALDLFEAGEDMMRQTLRRRFPAATPDEIERRLDDWMLERPGARNGDADGVPVSWPRPATP